MYISPHRITIISSGHYEWVGAQSKQYPQHENYLFRVNFLLKKTRELVPKMAFMANNLHPHLFFYRSTGILNAVPQGRSRSTPKFGK